MTDAPEALMGMVREAAEAHPDSVEDALNVLVNRWARCPARRTWAEELETRALREMIHRFRHQRNVQLRRSWGGYGEPAKVGLSTGAANAAAETTLLENYSISGRILGGILGEELGSLAAAEQEKAEGSLFNARLCSALRGKVPKGSMVREVLSERQVRNLFASMGKRDIETAA